jgi:hypothetical protein
MRFSIFDSNKRRPGILFLTYGEVLGHFDSKKVFVMSIKFSSWCLTNTTNLISQITQKTTKEVFKGIFKSRGLDARLPVQLTT